MEFSKKLLLLQYIVSAVLIMVTMIGCFSDHDISPVAALAGTSILADGTVAGFYCWKSKNENRAKYAQKFVRQFADKYGVDAAIRIAETVLKD